MRQHWNPIILQQHRQPLKQTNKTKHDKYFKESSICLPVSQPVEALKYKRNIAKDTSTKVEDQTLFSFLLTTYLDIHI